MALINWDVSYSVKVKRCDADHRKLFYLINALHEAMKYGKGSTIIAKIVRELESYTQTHFLAEEALLQRAQYPKLDDHRAQHQKFVAQVEEFRAGLESGGIGKSIEVLEFLKDWLAKHINHTDKMYSAHLNSQGIN